MKSKGLWLALIGILVLAVGDCALAETPRQLKLSGLISDYTLASGAVRGTFAVSGP